MAKREAIAGRTEHAKRNPAQYAALASTDNYLSERNSTHGNMLLFMHHQSVKMLSVFVMDRSSSGIGDIPRISTRPNLASLRNLSDNLDDQLSIDLPPGEPTWGGGSGISVHCWLFINVVPRDLSFFSRGSGMFADFRGSDKDTEVKDARCWSF